MNQINFLPASYRESVSRRRRMPQNFIAVLVTATVLVGVWQVTPNSEALAGRADELEMRLAENEGSYAEATDLKQQLEHIEARRAIAREIGQPVSTAQVLAAIAQVAPIDTKLTSIELVAHRPAPRPAAGGGPAGPVGSGDQASEPAYLEITIDGIAPAERDVVAFIRALSDHPLFSQVRLRRTGATQTRQVHARDFEVTLRVELERRFVPTHNPPEDRDAS